MVVVEVSAVVDRADPVALLVEYRGPELWWSAYPALLAAGSVVEVVVVTVVAYPVNCSVGVGLSGLLCDAREC